MATDGADLKRRVKYHGRKDGRPSKELLRPRPELARVQSDSLSDLTSINLGSCQNPAHTGKKALGLIKMERFTHRLARGFHPMSAADSATWEYPEAGSYFKEAADSLGMNFDDFLTKLRRTHYNFVQEWEDFACNVPSLRQHRRSAA